MKLHEYQAKEIFAKYGLPVIHMPLNIRVWSKPSAIHCASWKP